MKKEEVMYYGVLFMSGVAVALWFRRQYNNARKEASLAPTRNKRMTVFGVRG
jgi:hypothetical protein